MKKIGSVGMALLICCLFVSFSGSGFSFVTPEHYEKIKQQARIKEKNENKPAQEIPGKIQVHPLTESKPSPAGPIKK